MTIDELAEHGVERMDETEIRTFLSEQGVGVLGIPTQELPYMLPLSYGFDGEENLYFTYIVGETSQKTLVSDEQSAARFLVFEAPSETRWASVSLDGTLTRVPEHEVDSLGDSLEANLQPDALRDALESEDTRVYRFWIQSMTGIRNTDSGDE